MSVFPGLFGVLGDVHGDFDAVDVVMEMHPEVGLWLSVGDLGDDAGLYRPPRAPLFFIKGNNEDFSVLAALAAGTRTISNLTYVPNGTVAEAGGLRVAALGGTFAPTWYETEPDRLPAMGDILSGSLRRARDDKRRHYVRSEVEACARMERIDVLLTHEAPRPFLLEGRRGKFDAGRPEITAVLRAMRPRLHVFGHHHRLTEAIREGVPSVGLDVAARSYLIVDGRTMDYEICRPPVPAGKGEERQ